MSRPIRFAIDENQRPLVKLADTAIDPLAAMTDGLSYVQLPDQPGVPYLYVADVIAWHQQELAKLRPQNASKQFGVKEAEIIEDYFRARLRELGYADEIDKVHLPIGLAAEWFNQAMNERKSVFAASRILTQLIAAEHISRLTKNPSRKYGRGFLWNPIVIKDAKYEIETRIREFEKSKTKEGEAGNPNR